MSAAASVVPRISRARSEKKRVRRPLFADRARRSVTAYERHVVAEREELGRDRADQLLMVTARKVRPPYRPAEQDISGEREPMLLVHEDDAARRVAGAVENREGVPGDLDLVALDEPAIRQHVAGTRDPIGPARIDEALEQEPVRCMRPLDPDPESLLEFRRASRMIDMAVGEQDFLDRKSGRLHRLHDPVDIAAGIDHSAAIAGLRPDQGTVLLEGRDGNDGCAKLRHETPRRTFRGG